MTLGQWIMMIALLASCLLLILVILIQRGRGEGLAGAFGGGGGSSAFGAKTGDVFTGITVALAAIFLLLNVFGNYVFLPATPPPAARVAPAPTPTPMPVPATGTPVSETEKTTPPATPMSPPGGGPAAPDAEPGATGEGNVKTPQSDASETP